MRVKRQKTQRNSGDVLSEENVSPPPCTHREPPNWARLVEVGGGHPVLKRILILVLEWVGQQVGIGLGLLLLLVGLDQHARGELQRETEVNQQLLSTHMPVLNLYSCY